MENTETRFKEILSILKECNLNYIEINNIFIEKE